MGGRKMPKAGYYVGLPIVDKNIYGNEYRIEGQIIYTTGVRGGGGHKYWNNQKAGDHVPPDHNKWASLLWTCVPGQKELDNNYIYIESIEQAIEILNGGRTRKSPNK